MSREKQIEEISKILTEAAHMACEDVPFAPNDDYSRCNINNVECHRCKEARALIAAGYRKQSENTVEIETVKKWLYEMAINNVGCYLEGDFATACEQIISRLDGLKRFAEEMKGGAE